MRPSPRPALLAGVLVFLAALLAGGGRAHAAANLDPFQPAARSRTFTPLRLSQATPAQPAPAPSAAPTTCHADDQCPAGTICDNGTCTPVEPPIHALLFRKDGGATSFIPFYFSKRGNPGYLVVAPFYFHFWSPTSKSRVVFPFFWRFNDYIAQRVVTVVVPYSHTKQPDAESWAVWPIFYKSTKFGWAAPLLLSFKVGDPDQGRAYGLYALLYYWHRDHNRQTAFDLFVPLFVSSRSKDSAFTWALPLNFYWRSGDDAHLLALPLFYWNRDNTSGRVVTPLGFYSHAGQDKQGAVAWLYWFGRNPNGNAHDVLFPLVWSFRSKESSTTVVPPFMYLRRPDWTYSMFFPLYWGGSDRKAGSSWKLLIPFFVSNSEDDGRNYTWVSPVGGYHRDDDLGTRTLTMLVPPLFYRRDAERQLDMALFLFWRYRNLADGATTYVVGPYYQRRDNEGSTTTLFPLFWHFRDAATGATAHSFFPFYFRRSAPDQSLTAGGVFPLWVYYRNLSDGWGAGLFPLAFFGSRPDRAHAILLPLQWHFRDRDSTATVAAPLFYRFASRRSTNAGIVPLLYFWGGEAGERYHVQIPFVWNFSNERTGTSSTVVPPFYLTTGRDGWSSGLFPLLFASKWADRGHFVLFPIFWHFRDDKQDKSTTLVLNYLHRRQGGETTDAFLPLLYYRRGAKPGGTDESSFTLFPLVHYRRTAQTRLFLSPIAVASTSPQTKAGFVLPYFWYESKAIAASGVPLLYMDITKKETSERTRVFGPFVKLDTPTSHANILFPLFGRYHDSDESGTWVFPTFFHRRTSDGYAVDSLLPLFWHSSWPGASTTVVGPFYHRSGPGRTGTGLAPLFFFARDQARQITVIPPALLYHRSDYKNHTSKSYAALLFYRSTRPNGSSTMVFPLYWAGWNAPHHHAVLFPIFWHFADDSDDSSATLAGPFYASHTGTTQRTRGILPIAWHSRDDKADVTSNALVPLFYEKHGPGQLSILTLPFGFHNQTDQNWWYVLNVFHRDAVQSSFTTVFPLFFTHTNKATETHTTVIPPLLFFSRSRPDRGLTGFLMLFWRHHDIASSTTLALPLFYDVNNYHQSRLTMLLPIFFRYTNQEDRSAYTLAPFFYRRSSPQDSTTVAFPLYWDFKGGPERRTTVLFPLYVGVERPSYVSRYIFPTIYWRNGRGSQAGTSRFLIAPFWESAVKRPGDYMWEVLLGLFGWESIGRNRFVKVLFIPFKLDPAPAAQTAWYGRTPPRRPERRYGLDTRSW